MSHDRTFMKRRLVSALQQACLNVPVFGSLVAVITFQSLRVSAFEGQPTEQLGRTAVSSPAKKYEPFWYTGASGNPATNKLLNEWAWSQKPDATRSPSAAEIRDVLDTDNREVVDFHHVSLTNDIRSKLMKMKRVKWLRLSMGVVAADVNWLGEMRQLRGVSLARGDLRGTDFSALAHLDQLQWLNLSWAQFSDRDFRSLPVLPKLETLLLKGDSVGDRQLAHLAEVKNPLLSKLSLYYASVTDDGVDNICHAYRFEYLDLFCCRQVTERSLNSLSRQMNLRIVGIGGTGMCRDYSKNAAVKRLMELLPNATVDYGD